MFILLLISAIFWIFSHSFPHPLQSHIFTSVHINVLNNNLFSFSSNFVSAPFIFTFVLLHFKRLFFTSSSSSFYLSFIILNNNLSFPFAPFNPFISSTVLDFSSLLFLLQNDCPLMTISTVLVTARHYRQTVTLFSNLPQVLFVLFLLALFLSFASLALSSSLEPFTLFRCVHFNYCPTQPLRTCRFWHEL